MADIKSFSPSRLICGIISSREDFFAEAEKSLVREFGAVDTKSLKFDFDLTDYYENQMGKGLKRMFLSFSRFFQPDKLSEIKLRTNAMEEEVRQRLGENFRVINLDPGILTPSALIMATAKDFAHRIPLGHGIYAHLEFLFRKAGIQFLDWTYPDFKRGEYQTFFLEARRLFLSQLRESQKGE